MKVLVDTDDPVLAAEAKKLSGDVIIVSNVLPNAHYRRTEGLGIWGFWGAYYAERPKALAVDPEDKTISIKERWALAHGVKIVVLRKEPVLPFWG